MCFILTQFPSITSQQSGKKTGGKTGRASSLKYVLEDKGKSVQDCFQEKVDNGKLIDE